MRMHARRLLGVVAAGTLLLALTGSASARNLSTSTQNIRARWAALEFIGTEMAVTVRCPVTLEGSLHARTIAKVERALIGYITQARINRPCVGGTAWFSSNEFNEVLRETLVSLLPAHLTYEGFTGTLPSITGIRVLLSGLGIELRVSVFGSFVLCEYRTGATFGGNAGGTLNRSGSGSISGFTLDSSRRITSINGGLCPRIGLGGAGAFNVLNTVNEVSITLI